MPKWFKNVCLFFKTSEELGWGGFVTAGILLIVSVVEHLHDKNIQGYSLAVIAAVSFSFGAYKAWSVEHKNLLTQAVAHNERIKNLENGLNLVKTQRNDFASRLNISEIHRVTATDHNRPEVFASCVLPLIFEEGEVNS
jgi:hypothetical protein